MTPADLAHDGVTATDLAVSYGASPVIRDISLDAQPGETVAIVGPSGCGKSTTLRAIAGLSAIAAGRIRIGGREVTSLPASRRNVGLVPQSYAVFPHMSVAANVAYGLKARRLAAPNRARIVSEMLALTALTPLADRRPDQLSGGQRQRVALARALAISPDVLLLDEPLAALDPQLRGELRRELGALLSSTGCATLIVTHDQREALALGHRIAVLREGRLVQFGTAEQLWNDPADAFVADFLAGSALIDVAISEGRVRLWGGAWSIPVAQFSVRTSTAHTPRALLRADAVRMSAWTPSAAVGDDAVRGIVEHAEFSGGGHGVVVRVGDERLTLSSPDHFAPGTAVLLDIVPGRAQLLLPEK